MKLLASIKSFFADETGATAIEYGLMIALIAAVIVVAVTSLGGELNTAFNKVLTCIKTPSAASCTSS